MATVYDFFKSRGEHEYTIDIGHDILELFAYEDEELESDTLVITPKVTFYIKGVDCELYGDLNEFKVRELEMDSLSSLTRVDLFKLAGSLDMDIAQSTEFEAVKYIEETGEIEYFGSKIKVSDKTLEILLSDEFLNSIYADDDFDLNNRKDISLPIEYLK